MRIVLKRSSTEKLLNGLIFTHPFVKICKKTGLYYCSITLSEVLHVVEKSEKNLFCSNNSLSDISLKTFREKYLADWQKYCDEVNNIIVPMLKQFNEITTKVDSSINDSMLKQITSNRVDAYDCYMVATWKQTHRQKIITDDKDIARFNDIEVYTANESLLELAKTHRKLKD